MTFGTPLVLLQPEESEGEGKPVAAIQG
jgi:hypothetical protein